MTEIDPGNPYSPHKSWNNRTEREELIEILENPKLDSSGNFEQWHISHGAKSLADAILEWHKKEKEKEVVFIGKFFPDRCLHTDIGYSICPNCKTSFVQGKVNDQPHS